MAPPTRLNPIRTPSPGLLKGKEAAIRRKTCFYHGLAREGQIRPIYKIGEANDISETTARRWRDEYRKQGERAKYRSRSRSTTLGRKSEVTKDMVKTLCSPSRNPARKQPYEAQITCHYLPIKTRQLQRKIKELTYGGGRYKCAFVKIISDKNASERVTNDLQDLHDPIYLVLGPYSLDRRSSYQPTSQAQGRVTREPENFEERPPLKGVRFHIAAWISWWRKTEKLQFYNGEEDKIERPLYPPKPLDAVQLQSLPRNTPVEYKNGTQGSLIK